MLFETRYIRYRDSKISKIHSYKFDKTKIRFNNLHCLLRNGNVSSVTEINSQEYEFFFDTDSIYKALVGDIELYKAKLDLQQKNVVNLSDSTSQCWKYVTIYYYYFYCCVLFTRFAQDGFVFINSDKAKYLSSIIEALTSNTVSLKPGNYSFRLKHHTLSSSSIILKKNKRKPHEALWFKTNEILNQIKLLNDNEDYEFCLYESLLSFKHKPNIHSELRNQVNYRGISTIESIEKKIYSKNLTSLSDDKLNRMLLANTVNFNDVESKRKTSFLIGEFIARFTKKLYDDYADKSNSRGL